ncbi:hypothetical protein MJ561_15270 [Klebsiella pneumoniae]|nr:hypothetical protein MJ561_15270 [Klebsiella pneumoniae]
MDERACIILDPVNRENIDRAVKAGIKLFVGGNCSITLSLMGLAGLIKGSYRMDERDDLSVCLRGGRQTDCGN